jgi:hypothetical protein
MCEGWNIRATYTCRHLQLLLFFYGLKPRLTAPSAITL